MNSSFSMAQLDFLATLQLCDRPLPINLACVLSPLTPAELIDLTKKIQETGYAAITEAGLVSLTGAFPEEVGDTIADLNDRDKMARVVAVIEKNPSLGHELGPRAWAMILNRAGRKKEAALIEHEIAVSALRRNDNHEALEFFDRSVDNLQEFLGQPECDALFIKACIELSYLRYRSGRRLGEMMELLKKSREAALRLGDERSLILIELQMGRRVILENRPDEGLNHLIAGLEKAEKLGDQDILARSEEFRGLYYYIHGRFREAVEHLETALQRMEMSSGKPPDFLLPQWLAYSSMYRGQVNYARNLIGSHLQRALASSELAMAENFRATLGLILMVTGDLGGARKCLWEASENSKAIKNPLALSHADVGLADCLRREGQLTIAYKAAAKAIYQADRDGVLMRQCTWPWFWEMLFNFHFHGFPNIGDFDFPEVLERLVNGPNFQLRGVALRLRAAVKGRDGDDPDAIWADLIESEIMLKESGSTLELAKTWAEMALQKMKRDDEQSASRFANLAWERLLGFSESLFPKELGHLLNHFPSAIQKPHEPQELMRRFLSLMEGFGPNPDENSFFRRLLVAAGAFFEAERGAIFSFSRSSNRSSKKIKPVLRAAHNLTKEELNAQEFLPKIAIATRAIHAWRPLTVRQGGERQVSDSDAEYSLFCIPFELRGKTSGLLYLESLRPDECIKALSDQLLDQIMGRIGSYIEQTWDYSRLREAKHILDQKASLMEGSAERVEIVTDNPKLKRFLSQVDRVADSEATVLITGETGVGKELLAHRIHKMNPRRHSGSFVAVDITSIPETLLESDLFGHEKGAFSGAHRLKPGRLELADGGTLFIDEIGDIPSGIQVKLLRVLQEKSFYRVGGTQDLVSDFRLVAATNRNLEELVAAGKFREDLFYRLSVIPLEIPPLRERGRDIIVLAEYFLEQYMKKYQRYGLVLDPADASSLTKYSWPGNVRELKHVIERAVLLSSDGRLELDISERTDQRTNDSFSEMPSMDEMQTKYIKYVLEKTGNRISGPGGAATILGMKRTTLYARLKKLGIA